MEDGAVLRRVEKPALGMGARRTCVRACVCVVCVCMCVRVCVCVRVITRCRGWVCTHTHRAGDTHFPAVNCLGKSCSVDMEWYASTCT